MRYDKTERLGVIAADKIITADLGWIFREQPIIDVGLDAIIEEVIDGEPTGKFLAMQIKTGAGNFYNYGKGLSYYISNIHYHYWINLSLPIVLVAHLPEEDKTYWQQIDVQKIKKTNKRWKLDIPFIQTLDFNAKSRLEKLLSVKNDKNFHLFQDFDGEDDIDSLIEDIKCISLAAKCMKNIASITNDQTEDSDELTAKLKAFTESRVSISHPKVTAAYRAFANSLIITSKRLENEIEFHAELYSTGVFAFEKMVMLIQYHNFKLADFDVDTSVLFTIPSILKDALIALISLKETVKKLNLPNVAVKEAKKQYLEVLDLIYNETLEAKTITEQLIKRID